MSDQLHNMKTINARWYINLSCAVLIVMFSTIGFGHSVPMLGLLMDHYGASKTMIGANAAVSALALILSPFLYPVIMRRMGMRFFYVFCIVLMVASYLMFFVVGDHLWLWFPVRFFFSLGASGLFVGSEFWINNLTTDKNRGRVFGVYAAALALGFGIVPFIVRETGYLGFMPFGIGALIFSFALLPVILGQMPKVDLKTTSNNILPLLRRAPAIFSTAIIFGATETAILALMPVIMVSLAYADEIASDVIVAYAIGAFLFQFVLGWMADRFGRIRSLWICTIASIFAAISLFFALESLPFLYSSLFVLGGLLTAINTLGLILVGDKFAENNLAGANATLVCTYGIGTFFGPLIAGRLVDMIGTNGVPITMLGIILGFTALLFARRHADIP